MAWKAGSDLMNDIISASKDYIRDENVRFCFYQRVIIAMQNMDCNTLENCIKKDKTFADALNDLEQRN